MVQVATTDKLRVTTDKLYKLLGYREHRNLKEVINNNIEMFHKFGEVRRLRRQPESELGGRPTELLALNLDHCLLLSALSKNASNSKKTDMLMTIIRAYSSSSLLAVFNLISSIDIDEDWPDRFVYVAKEAESGRYKIGISTNPERRIRELNVGNPEQLILVHSYKAEESGYQSEALAHAMFEADRIRSEWFGSGIDLNLLPNYRASCKVGDANCDCLDCSNHSAAFDLLHDSEPSTRDAFISNVMRSLGFGFDDAVKAVDALEDTGAIEFKR